jgi:cytochrome c553
MTLMSAGLDKKSMKQLAQFYSEQGWVSRAPEESVDEKIASSAMTAGQCTQCHGNYKGINGIPRLAGQKESYLEETMRAFKVKERMNAGAKSALFATMSDSEIKAVANFLASQ